MHLAAESHVDRSITGAADFIQTNVIGTFTLLEAARGYWSGLDGAAKAGVPLPPCLDRRGLRLARRRGAVHRRDALRSELALFGLQGVVRSSRQGLARTYGLPVVVSNCSNNYGPYHFPEKLIPLTILNALAGERLPVYGKGENVRDWLYVEDHARALDLIAERGRVGETYNVGGRNERRNIDVVRRICAVLDRARAGQPAARGADRVRHRPARAMMPAMRSTRPSSRPSSAGARRRISTPASRRPCAGISTTNGGGGRCASATRASGSACSKPRRADSMRMLVTGRDGRSSARLIERAAAAGVEVVAARPARARPRRRRRSHRRARSSAARRT